MNEERAAESSAGGAGVPSAARVATSGDPLDREDRLVRGTALMLLRQYRRYTQSRLAELSGINKATISAYERGLQEIGEGNRRRMLRALSLPPRAWEATVRHVEWLDWLAEKTRREVAGPAADRLSETLGAEDLAGFRREVERIAEAAGRDRERQVGTLLELFAHLLE